MSLRVIHRPLAPINRMPGAVLKSMSRWLTVKEVARLVVTCISMKKTFSSGTHRHDVYVFNNLPILHIYRMIIAPENTTSENFKRYVVIEIKDALVHHIDKIIESQSIFLLETTLSSEKMIMTDELRKSVISVATKKGELALLNKFLAKGAISDEFRGHLVCQAAIFGRHSCLLTLLSNWKISNECRGEAISFAAHGGHLSCIRTLLTTGPISIKERSWAVTNAAMGGHLSCIEILIASGQISDVGSSIGMAAHGGHLSCIRTLLAIGEISEMQRGMAVDKAALRGQLSCIRFLLSKGQISDGYRCLAFRNAATGGHLSCVKELLEGSTQRFSLFDFDEAIRLAKFYKHFEVLAYLEACKPHMT